MTQKLRNSLPSMDFAPHVRRASGPAAKPSHQFRNLQSRTLLGQALKAFICIAVISFVHPAASSPFASSTVSKSRKIFHVGLSCTGGSAIDEALQLLGYNTLIHDRTLSAFMHDDRVANMTGHYDSVDAALDLPTSLYYKELLQAYPKALFILTIRHKDPWYRCFKRQMHALREGFHGWLPQRVARIMEVAYGSARDSQEIWMQHFEEHNQNVKATIPSKQLLIMNLAVGENWRDLCWFLNRNDGVCDPDTVDSATFPQERPELHYLSISRAEQEAGVDHNIASLGIQPTSKFAYVALLANVSDPGKREYLIGALVGAESIRATGSKEDIVFMVLGHLSADDEALILSENIKIVRILPVGTDVPVNYEQFEPDIAAIYRAKVRVLQLVEYEAVIFFDCDVIFLRNADFLFKLPLDFLGYQGFMEPLNTGFFMARPSYQRLLDMCDIASSGAFEPVRGWLDHGPIPNWSWMNSAHPYPMTNWTFWCASTDQGLFYYYFGCLNNHTLNRIGNVRELEDVFEHFAGVHKPHKFVHNFTAMPVVWRHPALKWLREYARIEKYATQVQSGVPMAQAKANNSRTACSDYPCDLERSTCKPTTTGYTCVCNSPYSGENSVDGLNCNNYLLTLSTKRRVFFEISEPDAVKNVTARDFASCRSSCETITNMDCRIFAFNSTNRLCIVYLTLARNMAYAASGFDAYVREGKSRFDFVFENQPTVFLSSLNRYYHSFYYTYIPNPIACQHLCDAHDDCHGLVFLYTSIRICIGLRTVGDLAGVPASTLYHVLGVVEGITDNPMCLRKHVR